jgi:predicted regulator of Ras-like GTPase activity (Roadblock/LC7/MglB family)
LLKQKTNAETAFSNETTITSVSQESSSFASLSASLAEILKLNGVTGYILRSSTSAIIDVADCNKIFSYATLTSEIHEFTEKIVKQFDLGVAESVLLEGENIKILCLNVDDNKISVFMEKSANHSGIIKRILL